jgi:hypothetical protein
MNVSDQLDAVAALPLGLGIHQGGRSVLLAIWKFRTKQKSIVLARNRTKIPQSYISYPSHCTRWAISTYQPLLKMD